MLVRYFNTSSSNRYYNYNSTKKTFGSKHVCPTEDAQKSKINDRDLGIKSNVTRPGLTSFGLRDNLQSSIFEFCDAFFAGGHGLKLYEK